MNENKRKLKRLSKKNVDETSLIQKKIRNENEKRRRDIFNELITNLGEILFDKTKKYSKNHLLKETVLFLKEQQIKNCSFFKCDEDISNEMKQIIDYHWKPNHSFLTNQQWFHLTIESMNSFLMILNAELKIEYLSKNISCYLLMNGNQSIYEFIHSNDHQLLKQYFSNQHQFLKSLIIRWKTIHSNQYELCQINGAFRKMKDESMKFVSIVQVKTIDRCLFNEENLFKKDQFVIHLNSNGRILSINSKTEEYLGYRSSELIGRTLFDLVHPNDIQILINAYQLWKNNVNEKSECYRILSKGNQWITIQTSIQIQTNSWNDKPLFYICYNYISQWNNKDQCSSKEFDEEEEEEEEEEESNEIKKFLVDVDNEESRSKIRSRLIELRESKEEEIRHRQDEIQILNDMITFLQQYQFKQSQSNQDIDLFSNILNSPFPTTTTTNVLSSPLLSLLDEQFNKDL